ncbi:hypothetical protein BUALT_Bualt07G0103500 [Buddleja alternifolia]|uniref:Uncharacterized protein n=1 Tax=Buddleja alternifolia TaxID=168488 RepID=A0AAV6XAM2_9LAMI|nr:hypothetical protein BUALT_Bualt07G0103500 [Buddleja alternifolia]
MDEIQRQMKSDLAEIRAMMSEALNMMRILAAAHTGTATVAATLPTCESSDTTPLQLQQTLDACNETDVITPSINYTPTVAPQATDLPSLPGLHAPPDLPRTARPDRPVEWKVQLLVITMEGPLLDLFRGSVGAAITDVTIDACVTENSISHPSLAGDMQTLCKLSSSVGKLISSKLCPSGIDGTFFVLLMSIDHIGEFTASWGGGVLLQLLEVTRTTFDDLWLAILVRSIFRVRPIGILFFIPSSDPNVAILPTEMLRSKKGDDELDITNMEMASLVNSVDNNSPHT